MSNEAIRRTIICIGGMFFGGFFGTMLLHIGAPWYYYPLVGLGMLFAQSPWEEIEND